MKNFVAVLCLAFVLCANAQEQKPAEGDDSTSVIDKIKQVMAMTSQLTQSIKDLLGNKNKKVPKESMDTLKSLGGDLGKTEGELSEQMGDLGDYLGVPKPPLPVPAKRMRSFGPSN